MLEWDTRAARSSRHPAGNEREDGERGGAEHPDAEEGDAHGVEPAEGHSAIIGGIDGLDMRAKCGAQALDAWGDDELRP